MRWHCILFKLFLLAVLVLLLVHPAAARGNTTPGIYPGTVKDVCVGDTIFVGEKGLNLTPLTPNANGVIDKLRKYVNDIPGGVELSTVNVKDSTNFDVPTVSYYGIYYPVMDKHVLAAYPIQIQPAIPMYPQNVVIKSGSAWVVANGADSASLTVTVTDGSNNPVQGADLVLSASTPWGLRDAILKTDGSGVAQTLFLPTTKSGDAVITVSVTVQGVTTAPVTTTLVQKVDSDTPYAEEALYPSMATVGSPVTISVLVTDRFGNPVTSRRAVNNVSFLTTTSGTAVFLDGAGTRLKAITLPLNETGWAAVTFLVGTKQGSNFVSITPPSPVPSSIISITGVGDSRPFSISQTVNPAGNPPLIPADGSSQATIDYYLYDQWGNPSSDQGIKISTSAGENRIFYTNADGRATILYGPKLNAGMYSITATAEENSSVRISQLVKFASMDPKDMLLTAIPQTMASLDVNSEMVASVIAQVIDERGNPVKGQMVNFSIEKSDNGTFVQTQGPVIMAGPLKSAEIGVPISTTTDENGQAILSYYPGAFPVPYSDGWNANAQGTTIINATWVGKDTPVVRNISLNYKNYPFISVYTEATPRTVMMGEMVNVSVRLKGDGWALQPKPIDVILCTDRSATMLNNESVVSSIVYSESLNDRMVDAMRAAQTFVDQTSAQDRVGLVTFGDPYGGIALLNRTGNAAYDGSYLSPFAWRTGKDYACKPGKTCSGTQDSSDDGAYVSANYPGHGPTGKDYRVNGVSTGVFLESALTPDKSQVKKAISSIVPAGGTPMRQAIYESIQELIKNGQPGSVQAIILLTDGKWDRSGDPQGLDLKSYGGPTYYPEVPAGPGGDGRGSVITWAKMNNIKIFTIALGSEPYLDQLQAYAAETGGKYHTASSSKELDSVYREIAGELRVEASVDTKVSLDFSVMEVNTTYTFKGNDIFEYLYLPPNHSTYIVPPEPPTSIVNNTKEWESGQPFTFSAGTIKVDQQWMVNFTLMAWKEGNIRLLSRSSKVTFVGKEGEVSIPDTYVTVFPFGLDKGPEGITCSYTNLRRTNPASDTQIAQLAWDPAYNGPPSEINWSIGYAQPYSGVYTWGEEFPKSTDLHTVDYPLLIKDMKPGTYTVKVIGRVKEASSDCLGPTLQLTLLEPTVTPQILIQ
jgi:protocatechuate 3,4-dioxygenase beta subunit